MAFSPAMSNEETINLYVEKTPSGYALIKSPGYSQLYNTGNALPCRGIIICNVGAGTGPRAYVVAGSTIYEFFTNPLGGQTGYTFGPIANDGNPVTIAASSTQIVICSAGVLYMIEAGSLSTITWPSAPIAAVAFLNQYFLYLAKAGNGFFYSEPGDADSGTALNFRTAEANANPYISMLISHEEIWLYGTQVTQVFYNDANDAAEPFKPNLNAVIEQGTASAFSPIALDNSTFWIGSNAEGSAIAWRSRGYGYQDITNPGVANIWRKYSRFNDAISWKFQIHGHQMWRIYFPAADDCWQYDATVADPALAWTRQLTWDVTAGTYHAHVGICAYFDPVSQKILMGDRTSGIVHYFSPEYYSENGSRIRWLRRGPTILSEDKRISYPSFGLNMETGVGDGSGSGLPEDDPIVTLRVSNDAGKTFGKGRDRSFGKQGAYDKIVRWDGLGSAYQRQFEITGIASVKTVIAGAYLGQPQ